MESFFRSESVSLCQIYIQNGTAFDVMAELGELGIVSLLDLNPDVNAYQRRFTNEIVRCDQIQYRLDSMLGQLRARDIPILDTSPSELTTPKYRDLLELEQFVEHLWEELRTFAKNRDEIRQTFVKTLEQYSVLSLMDNLLGSLAIEDRISIAEVTGLGQQSVVAEVHVDAQQNGELSSQSTNSELSSQEQGLVELNTLTGQINRDRLYSFERVLYRLFGRNIFMRTIPMERPMETTEPDEEFQHPVFFVLYFNGQQLIRTKLSKVCRAFGAQLYGVSADPMKRTKQIADLDKSLADLRTVLARTTDFLNKSLRNCAKEISKWRVQNCKLRAAFSALNKLDYDSAHNSLICKFWCPDKDRQVLSSVLNYIDRFNEGLVPTILEVIAEHDLEKPTFFRLNKFTEGFQGIVESYGVATYQEINPAPYTVITFPFLFAVMFGDAGHGLLMALFGAWMVLYERPLAATRSRSEIWSMFFGGRYIILLMGLFAIYTGLLYNDFFAKSLNIFGSSFSAPTPGSTPQGLAYRDPVAEIWPTSGNYSGVPYPWGIDPVWQLSQNKIIFLNSYKMKLSVLLGVMQMLFGVALSCVNHRFFRKPENILFEFIPQLLFLCSIFGYMLVLIVVKWLRFSYEQQGNAPSILINLINMFLMKYPEDGPIYLQQWYPHQKELQTFLLILALVCIPWILIPKVIYLRHKHHANQYSQLHSESSAPAVNFNLGDTFIYQAIHTIEYCLGSVSHTASYLRLWALSLAHSQLSEVLWSMVLRPGLSASMSSPILNAMMMLVCFVFWALLSIAVLIVMEGLSAFLHALRLHWVEFQSKFYSGSGVKFEPFSFGTAIQHLEITE